MPPLLHHDRDPSNTTRESKSSREMANPITRETAGTLSDRARSVLPPTRCNWPPEVPSHTVDRDFSRDLAPSRAGRTSTPEISTPAVATEDRLRCGRERATPVPAPPPRHIEARCEGQDSSTPRVAYANGSRVMFSSERSVAHATPIAATSSTVLAPPSSWSDSPLAVHPLRQPPADVRAPPPRPVRAAARSSDARTAQAASAREHTINDARPTRRGARPSSSLTHVRAATHHSPALATLHTGRHARMENFASLGTADSRKEYTGADRVRLAGAPAQGRGQGSSRAHCVAHRADSICLNATAAAHSRQISLMSPPQSIIQPPPSRPAPLKHPTLATHPISVEVDAPPILPPWPVARSSGRAHQVTRLTPSLVDTRMYEEYTSADTIRLAGAPSVARVVPSAVPAANGCASYAGPQCTGELSRAPPVAYPTSLDCARTSLGAPATEGVFINATKHPPPPLPPPSTHQLSHSSSPTPPGWPFPISVTEMGWVLAAVVMARNMDREDERRQHEHDDDDYLSMWEPNNQDESDGVLRIDGSNRGSVDDNYHDDHSHNDNSAATCSPAPTITLSECDGIETVTYDGWYTDSIAGSTSPVPSLTTSITGSGRDNVDTQDWDETSALAFDELRDFVYDHEEYEQDLGWTAQSAGLERTGRMNRLGMTYHETTSARRCSLSTRFVFVACSGPWDFTKFLWYSWCAPTTLLTPLKALECRNLPIRAASSRFQHWSAILYPCFLLKGRSWVLPTSMTSLDSSQMPHHAPRRAGAGIRLFEWAEGPFCVA
ncbi:hypothetical protein EV121DRAFT_267584 [Schizophyllum commune]